MEEPTIAVRDLEATTRSRLRVWNMSNTWIDQAVCCQPVADVGCLLHGLTAEGYPVMHAEVPRLGLFLTRHVDRFHDPLVKLTESFPLIPAWSWDTLRVQKLSIHRPRDAR
jgi:hypothetical protein